MPRPGKRVYLLMGLTALVFGAVAALVLHALPTPHTRLHYLAAGVCGTCALLVEAFFVLRRARPDAGPVADAIPVRRTAPESAPPS